MVYVREINKKKKGMIVMIMKVYKCFFKYCFNYFNNILFDLNCK